MYLTLLTLVTALAISAVAIYYSVAGLAAIFAAAVWPIVIMGTTLEIAKLVTTVWLHRYWQHAVWWLKTYLTVAVVILMFITSMGIFGFLSKAHIDQTTASSESVAQVTRMGTEIARQNEIIERAEARIKQIETVGVGGEANVQTQIQQEQSRIDSAYARVQPAIDEQQRIIDGQTKLFQDQITKIDEQIDRLKQLIDAKNISAAQALVGTRPDGNWGPATARSIQTWQEARQRERNEAVSKLEQVNGSAVITAARAEIQRVRLGVESQIADSNRLINRLREQLGKTDTTEVERLITDQRERVTVAQKEIDRLTEQKYRLEGEYRKLEAEVGPVKYIAEFIYGSAADKNMLEEAVRWVIIIIIFVFDPLAVLLLLASQYSFEYHRRQQREATVTAPVVNDPVPEVDVTPSSIIVPTPTYEQDDGPLSSEQIDQIKQDVIVPEDLVITSSIIDIIPPVADPVPEKKTKKIKKQKTVPDATEVVNITEVVKDNTPIDPEIITTGVTIEETKYFHPNEQYVQYDGKLMSIDALREQHPEMVLPKNAPLNLILFGSEFPGSAKSGDIYIRVDVIPHRVYKFNGTKWINLDRYTNTTYLQDENYIKYLIEKIDTKQYDVDLLTDFERDEITNFFKK